MKSNEYYKEENVIFFLLCLCGLFICVLFALDFIENSKRIENPSMELIEKVEKKYLNGKLVDDFEIDDTGDITDVVCPTTFVKAKVAIEELDDGQILAVRMNDGEPVQNVPRSMKEEGHKILKLEDNADGTYTLYVRKVEE